MNNFLNGGPIPGKSFWFWLTYDPIGLGLLIMLVIAILVNLGFMLFAYLDKKS